MSTTITDVQARPFDLELAFTDTYQQHRDAHPAIREAVCLKALYPGTLRDIQDGDLLAGRWQAGPVGFALEQSAGGFYYYCHADRVRARMNGMELPSDYRQRIEDMLAYWAGEESKPRIIGALPQEVQDATLNDIADMGCRLAGPYPDVDQLMRLGLPGLRAKVAAWGGIAEREGRGTALHDGMLIALDVVADSCGHYAAQAREAAADCPDETRRAELLAMARVLDRVVDHAPATFQEALQLFWIYMVVSRTLNFGRLDVFTGDFLAADLAAGRIDEESALALLVSLFRIISAHRKVFNSRIIVGGVGRRNERNADRVALLCMEAQRIVHETTPQLTLRFHKDQDPALMAKALDVIGEGCTFPMLYNDDSIVPAVASAFDIDIAEAQQYLPYGCGEYGLLGMSVGSPNNAFNLLKALEVVLHNGRDALTGERLGLQTGDFLQFQTFEELWEAYARQVEFHGEMLAKRHELQYGLEAETCAALHQSMLFEGCVERGRSVFEFGTRYTGGLAEVFAITNVADALVAMRRLVYETKAISPERLVAALDADFEGYEQERRMILACPKFGNDDPEVDAMARRVSDHVSRCVRDAGLRSGLDYYMIVCINNHSNVDLGRSTAASADGRLAGTPLANAMTPTAGNDRNGVTAFLKSISSIDARWHAGYVHNMKFSRRMFREDRAKLEDLLDTYWKQGGTQAMITVVDRGDLEDAVVHPERHSDLMVRIGGFSMRFVELNPEVQQDVLNRTLY